MTPMQPPEGAAVFAMAFTPAADDIDMNGHVNNVVYMHWVQTIAIAHWNVVLSDAERAPWAWVAVRHEIDYRRPLMPHETAAARTWVGTVRGPRFERFVRIDGPDGGVCAQTRSDWVLLDAATKKPVRVPADLIPRFR